MLQMIAVLPGKDAFSYLEILHQAAEIFLIFRTQSSCIPVFFIQDVLVKRIGFRLYRLAQIQLV